MSTRDNDVGESVKEMDASNHSELEEPRRQGALSYIVDPSTSSDVPFAIRSTAVEVLTALVARKDEHAKGGDGLSQVSRHEYSRGIRCCERSLPGSISYIDSLLVSITQCILIET